MKKDAQSMGQALSEEQLSGIFGGFGGFGETDDYELYSHGTEVDVETIVEELAEMCPKVKKHPMYESIKVFTLRDLCSMYGEKKVQHFLNEYCNAKIKKLH